MKKILLIRIPLNSKQNLADEWLRINQTQPVYNTIVVDSLFTICPQVDLDVVLSGSENCNDLRLFYVEEGKGTCGWRKKCTGYDVTSNLYMADNMTTCLVLNASTQF